MADAEHWGRVEELVNATGMSDEHLDRVVCRIGVGTVARLLADEVQSRCGPVGGIDGFRINLVLYWAGEQHRHLAAFDDDRITVTPGAADDASVEIRFAVPDLARLLYPAHADQVSTSRDVRILRWPWEDLPPADDLEAAARQGSQASQRVHRAVQMLLNACSAWTPTLNELSTLYGSDKWGMLHWYTQHYERHFTPVRYQPVRVLEIGVGGYNLESMGGESLYMWQRFFPRGLIFGLDIHAKPMISGPRVRVVQGDQNDPDFLQDFAVRHGPFDIVIDDGSHINEHVRTSYEALFRHVRPGGLYVIEDLHTSYWPTLGGEPPPGSPSTTMGLLKDLIDRIHLREYTEIDDNDPADDHPAEITVHHNLAVLRKGTSAEPGAPKWIRDGAEWLAS